MMRDVSESIRQVGPLSVVRRRLLTVTAASAGAWLCGCASLVAPVGDAARHDASLPSEEDGPVVAGSASEPTPTADPWDASLVDADFWRRPRALDLVRPQTGERLSLVYWRDGTLLQRPYEHLCHALRDVSANRRARIDPALVDVMWAAQAFVARHGIEHPVEVLSGYRTRATNRRSGGAVGSWHTKGRAVDFRVPGLPPAVLGRLVRGFCHGGVGVYTRSAGDGGWIHADTGAMRDWRG